MRKAFSLIASIAMLLFPKMKRAEAHSDFITQPLSGGSLFEYHDGGFNMHAIMHARRHNQTRKRRG